MTDSEKLDLILESMGSIDNRLKEVENSNHDIKSKMSNMELKMSDIESDLSFVKQKVTRVDMTMENELQVNIMRVAEGHIDLSRNLAEIKRDIELLNGKMEMNDLFIPHHDSEIKKLKAL